MSLVSILLLDKVGFFDFWCYGELARDDHSKTMYSQLEVFISEHGDHAQAIRDLNVAL